MHEKTFEGVAVAGCIGLYGVFATCQAISSMLMLGEIAPPIF